jgi:hypothetical protein
MFIGFFMINHPDIGVAPLMETPIYFCGAADLSKSGFTGHQQDTE